MRNESISIFLIIFFFFYFQQGTIHPSPHSSSFLQSLLNGETSGLSQSPTNKSASALPPLTASTPPVMSLAGNSNLSAVFPSLISEEGNKLEYAVTKLTKKHLGLNNARESYQCQVCSKWFAVPPIKHLRGHLVTFKDELRYYTLIINKQPQSSLSSRSNSSQMSTFNFQHFLCNEFPTFVGNARI